MGGGQKLSVSPNGELLQISEPDTRGVGGAFVWFLMFRFRRYAKHYGFHIAIKINPSRSNNAVDSNLAFN